MRKIDLLLPTLLSVLALGILLWLGSWQLNRHVWKQDILKRIDASLASAPLTFAEWNGRQTATDENTQGNHFTELEHVLLSGYFLHDREVYVYAVQEGRPGYDVLTPLKMDNNVIIFVKRGFVPDYLRDPETRRESLVPGRVSVRGITRFSQKPGWFTPEPDVKRKIWYGADLNSIKTNMTAELNLSVLTVHYIQAARSETDPASLRGTDLQALIRNIPNRHLEYAWTWFGLAMTLVGVYLAFVVNHLRKNKV